MAKGWSGVWIESIDSGDPQTELGSTRTVEVKVELGTLTPADVAVQLLHGSVGPNDELASPASVEETRVPRDLPPYLQELYRTPLLSPRRVDEDLLHRTGGGFEEMSAIGEMLLTVARDLQPRLMHQGRGLKGLAGALVGHAAGGEVNLRDSRAGSRSGFRVPASH